MAFDELQPDPVSIRTAKAYHKGMKELGRGLIVLAVLQLLLGIGLLSIKFYVLLVILGFLASVHVGLGVREF